MAFAPSNAGEAFVEVRRSTAGLKPGAEQALLTKLGELANQLKGCHSLIVEAGDTVAPWKTKSKSRAAQDALSKQQAELQAVMADLEGTSLCHVSEADSLAYKLQQKEQALRDALAANQALEASLKSATGRADKAEQQLQAATKATEALEQRAQAAEAQASELEAATAKLTKARDTLAAKLKDVTAEYQDTADVAEREIRRLQTELKKAEDAKAAALVQSSKESSDALAEKVRECRSLQRRYESMKAMAEANREAAAAAKKQAEEAIAAQARVTDAADAQARRVSEARAARDAAQAELEALRSEHGALRDVFMAAGGADAQAAAAWAAAARAGSSKLRAGLVNGSSMASPRSEVAKLEGSRIALRAKGGWCLHVRRTCGVLGGTADVNRMVTVPYADARGLEEVLRTGGLFMCPRCSSEPGFFA